VLNCALATAITKCPGQNCRASHSGNDTDTWELVRIYRKAEREAAVFQDLAGPAYGLKRGGTSQPYGILALRARVHPFDFLLHLVPRLAQAGFEVYGEDKLKIGKINRSTPQLRVNSHLGLGLVRPEAGRRIWQSTGIAAGCSQSPPAG